MDIGDEDIEEFKIEALELLEDGETGLLNIDQGGEFGPNYDSIFRVFHSLKGGAGMLGLEELQNHMHKLENLFTQCKSQGSISKDHVSYFLKGVDGAKSLLEGESIEFTYLESLKEGSAPAPATTPEPAAAPEPTAAPAPAPPAAPEPAAAPAPAPPAAPEPAAAPAPAPATTPVPAPTPRPTAKIKSEGLVYVVDDEEDIVSILEDVVSEAGFEVKGFTDPEELLVALKDKKPDALLSDMKMPKLTGLDVLHQVHALDPDLPVIFVSAYVTKDLLIDAISSGIFGAVEKPIDERLVIGQVTHAVRRAQLTRLLNRTIKFLMYQFSDLDDFLASQGKDDLRKTMKHELDTLLEQRRKLRDLMTAKPAEAAKVLSQPS